MSKRLFLLLLLLLSLLILSLAYMFGRQTGSPLDSVASTNEECPKSYRFPDPPPQTTSNPETIPESMKGYEVQMQCWQGEWYFTFRLGLNRIRPCEETDPSSADNRPSYTVKGYDGLQAALIHIHSAGQIDTMGQVIWCESGNISEQEIMPGTRMTTSAVTQDKSLWYAFDRFDDTGGSPPNSKNQGLFRLKDGQVSHFDVPNTIRVIEPDRAGALFIGAGCGILRFQNDEMETLLDLECDRRTSVSELFPMDIDVADDGLVWVSGVYSLASYDGQKWQEFDIHALRTVVAPDGSLWARGWDGRAGSGCCLTHISGGQWMTYTWTADIPADPQVLSSLFD